MQTFVTLWALSIPVLVVLDLLWLGVVASNFYQTRLEHLLGDVKWLPAIAFYAIFTMGLTFFVSVPHVQSGVLKLCLAAALFGFVTYATYDLTNHATLREWPLAVTLVDIIWGTILSTLIAVVVHFLYHYFA